MSIDILKKIDSPEYKLVQNDLIKKIIKDTKKAPNEATVASKFENNLYNHLLTEFGVEMDLTKEVTSNDGVAKHFEGRMDGVVSNLVIEYKKNTKFTKKKDIDKAISQLVSYLEQLKNQNLIFDGFLTDGSHYIKAYYAGDKLIVEKIRPLDAAGINFLILEFSNLNKKQLISKNLQMDFGENSFLADLQGLLYKLLINNFSGKKEMLFEEWMDIFHLSLNDDGKSNTLAERRNALSKAINVVLKSPKEEYMALFSMQTAYAIVLKIFALKILPKIDFNSNIKMFDDLLDLSPNELQIIFKNIEDGYIFQTSNVANLLEGDFYSWYTEDDIWSSELSTTLQKIIQIVSSYADASLSYKSSSSDIFKDLYMIAIPKLVRKSFGEVFTPDWLADQVVHRSIEKIEGKRTNWTFLDPTAGSGTFLIRAINNIVSYGLKNGESNSEILSNVLNRVTGIDLNPLSVLAGRVNYLLAIRPFMDGRRIEIPFFLGDSARLPQSIMSDGTEYIKYDIDTQKTNIEVIFPLNFILSKNFLNEVYSWQTYINIGEPELLYEAILANFPENCSDELKVIVKRLCHTLVKLKQQNWDGIWLKIVSNFVLTTRIKDIDIIAGNPPWVKWENLPKNYASKIKHIAGNRELFSGKNKGLGGGINLNLAALISNVTAFQWLSEEGVLAFLMPDTLLNSDSYEGWRKFTDGNGNYLYLDEVNDWSKSGDPFTPVKEKFLTYFFKKTYDNNEPILRKFIKKFPKKASIVEINENKSWFEASKYYEIKDGILVQLSKKSNRYSRVYDISNDEVNDLLLLDGINHYKARQGVELTPKEVYIFNKIDFGTFSNVQVKATKIKPKHFEKVKIEDELMHPLLQSKNVNAWVINNEFDYGLLPYNSNAEIYTIKELSHRFPKAFSYLVEQKEYIDQQSERSKMMARGNEFYALSKIGEYSLFDYAVVFRDNTTMKASFVDNTVYDIPVFPVKHAPFISRDSEGNPLTANEAKYLTGILNLPIIADYFKVTYSDRSFSINFDINIPKYNDDNYYQKRMVLLVDEILNKIHLCTGAEEHIEKLTLKIQEIYLEFLKSLL